MTLPAVAVERGRLLTAISIDSWYAAPAPAAVDRYLLPAGRSATNPPVLPSIDGTDRQTDGRTLDRFIDPVTHAGGVIKH